MTRVALMWHMHQPFYQDLVTGEHLLPWVRMHALKDYWGMVALLREFPAMRATFNLVPSLLVQLQAFADERARDRHLEIGLKPADTLSHEERAFCLDEYFHAHGPRMIAPYRRYDELQRKRARVGYDPAAFTTDELRDLQVWHKLAWLDPYVLDADPRARTLVDKGQYFSEADKRVLRDVELDLLRRVVPEYADAVARGQIEIATSPFYHPILPLLCDSDIYLRTHPHSRMPRERFRHPADAAEQLHRAVSLHESLFGRRPVGLWPSEGSVSDAMVPLAVEAGFTWMATDEEILGRSLAHHLDRDDRGQVRAPELLYRPYQVGGQIACGFRDHALSDLIGFSYASWPADGAARDFTQRLVDAGRHYAARTGGHDATIFVILDGENAWEHYDGQGRPFLRALYGRLTSHPELQTVTMAEACAPSSNQTALPSIFPGSWINGDFYIWIGHDDDRRAWSQLGDARRALDAAAPRLTPTQHDTAYEELLIAEGSDWYWWYGDDHSSSHDAAFDELFRRHLRNVYRTIDTPTPAELFTSNITTAATPRVGEPPLCEVSPSIDGQHTSYFEWVGAGQLALKAPVGAMHEVTAEHTWCTALTYGLDGDALVLALSGPVPMKDLIGDRLRVGIALAAPIERLVLLDEGSGLAAISVGHIIEARLPGPLVGLATGSQHCAFFVTLHERGSNRELARLPEGSPIEITRQAGGLSAWP